MSSHHAIKQPALRQDGGKVSGRHQKHLIKMVREVYNLVGLTIIEVLFKNNRYRE